MDGGSGFDTAAGWRHITCDRIHQFRLGTFDFDGLLMFCTLMAKFHEDGIARLRPAVTVALQDFLAVAGPLAHSQPAPSAQAVEPELRALHDAVVRQTD